jgi:hypothetical protein
MDVHNSRVAGWILALGGFLLLAAMGKLDLVILLIPIAAAVGYGVARLLRGDAPVKHGLQ